MSSLVSRRRPSPGALVLAAALPFLLLHRNYNPGLELALGSTTVSIELSDLAVAAILVAAAIAARHTGIDPLRGARAVWLCAGSLVALVVAGTLWGPFVTDDYPFATSAVSAAKFVEYALLMPAVPLLLRRREDAFPAVAVLVFWCAAATGVGVLQFIGLIGNLDLTPPGRRMPSFLGFHDFGALAGVVLGLAIAAIAVAAFPRRLRFLVPVAATAGAAGAVVAGAIATVGGIGLGTLAVLLMAQRSGTLTLGRVGAVSALAMVVVVGTLALRVGDVGDFFSFVRASKTADSSEQIESYSQRTLLVYIGLRIFADHPMLGVGWQGSKLESNFGPYLDDARRRFPDVAPDAFPSLEHPWGVQNAYVQAAADLGVIGLVAIVATIVAGLATAARGAWRGEGEVVTAGGAAFFAIAVCAFEWAALGLVPGVPATALLWLGLGSSVALPRA